MNLLKLQQSFKDILFQKEDDLGFPVKKEMTALSSSLILYQNNLYQSLYKSLSDKFKMTHSLLGEEDFFETAKQYIFTTPQISPYLCEYGEQFPCMIKSVLGRELAALEWRMNLSVLSYRHESSLCYEDIVTMNPRLMSSYVLRLHPSVKLHSSSYALKEVWLAIKKGKQVSAYKNFSYFFISTENKQSSFFSLTEEEYFFLKTIKEGQSLGSAYTVVSNVNDFQNILSKFMPYFVEVQNSLF